MIVLEYSALQDGKPDHAKVRGARQLPGIITAHKNGTPVSGIQVLCGRASDEACDWRGRMRLTQLPVRWKNDLASPNRQRNCILGGRHV